MNDNSQKHLTVPSLGVLPVKAHPSKPHIAGGVLSQDPKRWQITLVLLWGYSPGVCLGQVLRSYHIPGCLFLTCVCAFCLWIITSLPLTLYPFNNHCCVQLWNVCPLSTALNAALCGGLSSFPLHRVPLCVIVGGCVMCGCVCVYWATLSSSLLLIFEFNGIFTLTTFVFSIKGPKRPPEVNS